MQASASSVIELAAKSGIERYSVTHGGSVEILMIFSVSGTTQKIVQCHSSLCKMSQGSSREFLNLAHGSLCVHLQVFKRFYLEKGFPLNSILNEDEDNGLNHIEDISIPIEKAKIEFVQFKLAFK